LFYRDFSSFFALTGSSGRRNIHAGIRVARLEEPGLRHVREAPKQSHRRFPGTGEGYGQLFEGAKKMAKAMTKSQIMAALAEKCEMKKKQAKGCVEALVALAYKEAKNGFTIPGLGKLVTANRPAREMVMRFGPKVGQTIQVPAKRVVKFRLAKAAKDAILKK
jgi:DNA-binding protein HU-beta